MQKLIKNLPKAELHLHIEGTLQPKLTFKLSKKNKIQIPYQTQQQIIDAYKFSNLQQFLDIYYTACKVLIEQEDFCQLAWEYFLKCKEDNIRHTQIFFDPQTHTARGISFSTIIKGLIKAQERAEQELKITSYLIMCFLRHLDEESAFKALEQAFPYKKWIIGVGLDSGQVGNPPQKFQKVYGKAKEQGYRLVAHAGQEGPSQYIWGAIKILNVQRIDHGVRCIQDKKLIQFLRQTQMPLTCCPLSNLNTKVFPSMKQNTFKYLLNQKLNATINSDDPAYFNGYLTQNYLQTAQHLSMSVQQIKQAAINSFKSSFLPKDVVQQYIKEIQNL